MDTARQERTTMTEDEIDLVRRCASGDSAAWDGLVTRYGRLVWSVARDTGLGEHSCEDALQETFAAAATSISRIKEPHRFDAWLATTARRIALRIRMRERRSAAGTEPTIELGTADADLEDALETRLMVRGALAELTDRCRELLLTLFGNNAPPSYDALAEQLGLPRGSLGPTRQRCLDRLAELLVRRGIGGNRGSGI